MLKVDSAGRDQKIMKGELIFQENDSVELPWRY